jgi:mercuric ion transport protein
LAVIHDSCLAPLAAVMLAIGLAAAVAWVWRRRKADRCGEDLDSGCASDVEVETAQPSVFRPRP